MFRKLKRPGDSDACRRIWGRIAAAQRIRLQKRGTRQATLRRGVLHIQLPKCFAGLEVQPQLDQNVFRICSLAFWNAENSHRRLANKNFCFKANRQSLRRIILIYGRTSGARAW